MLRILPSALLAASLVPGCISYEHAIDEPEPHGADADADTDTDSDTDTDTDSDSDTETGSETGQCAAVDILFVVPSGAFPALDEMRANLSAALPDFVDALWERLPPGTSVHTGFTTGDFSDQPICDAFYENCVPTTETEAMIPDHYTTPDVLQTAKNGGQGRLLVHDEMAYFDALTSSGTDAAALAIWLTGAVDALGSDGCSYVMYAAAAGWIGDVANSATNAGFLRDAGAVLLIVFVATFPDLSPGPVEDYKAMVASAKPGCGVDECTVAAGLYSYYCDTGDSPWSPALFLDLFGETPLVGYVEYPADYPLVLGGDLAEIVAQTCDEIGPA